MLGVNVAIHALLEWVRSPQPPDALLQHHGAYLGPVRFRDPAHFLDLRLSPQNERGGGVVLVCELHYTRAELESRKRTDPAASRTPELTDAEEDLLRSAAAAHATVLESWNGHRSMSIRLDVDPHPELLAAVDRYHHKACADCPRPVVAVFCECPMRKAGHAATVFPILPAAAGAEV